MKPFRLFALEAEGGAGQFSIVSGDVQEEEIVPRREADDAGEAEEPELYGERRGTDGFNCTCSSGLGDVVVGKPNSASSPKAPKMRFGFEDVLESMEVPLLLDELLF